MINVFSDSPDSTLKIAELFSGYVQKGDVIALSGDLGAGKTKFVKGLCIGLGIKETVLSPTFSILNIYECNVQINHFDFYRIKNEAELDEIGFYEFFNKDSITIIEWADLFPHVLPEKYYYIKIKILDENEKRLIGFDRVYENT